MVQPLIALQGTSLEYAGAIKAVDQVDLSVSAGEFLAIVGPSGSGKTSLLNLIGGLERPTSGSARVGELDLGKADDRALSAYRSSQIGFVFQSFHLHPGRTALENTSIPLYFSQSSMKEGLARCRQLLERLGLSGMEHRPVSRLSGGQRQRVAIARALVNRPQILLADEPIGHLDGETAGVVLTLLADIHKEENVTLVVVTHDMSILDVAQRTVTMAGGKLVA